MAWLCGVRSVLVRSCMSMCGLDRPDMACDGVVWHVQVRRGTGRKAGLLVSGMEWSCVLVRGLVG